jgi:integrase
MTQAVKQGFIKNSPCNKAVYLPKNKNNESKINYLNQEQIHTLLNMVNGYSQFNTIIKVLLYTGVRIGECLALQWKDIDFKNKQIHINSTLVYANGKYLLTPPKTKNSNRKFPISDNLVNILREHQEEQKKIIKLTGGHFLHSEMLFTSETGNYKDRSALNATFRKFIADTDFNYLTLHGLRHTFATLLISKGYDITIVSKLLGHSTIGITVNHYVDAILDSKKIEVAKSIDNEFNNLL